MMERSLVRTLIGWQLAAMSIAWFCLLGWIFFMMTAYENGDLDRRMSYFAQILAEAGANPSAPREVTTQRLKAIEEVFTKGIIENLGDAYGYVATYQVEDALAGTIYQTPSMPQYTQRLPDGFSDLTHDGVNYRAYRVKSQYASVAVTVVESTNTRLSSLLPMLRIIGSGQLFIFLVCIAVLWWTARRAVRPIADLTSELRSRSGGHIQPLTSDGVYEEVRPLTDALNEFLRREQTRLDLERGFIADAAHELRTPLAAISAQAHLLTESLDASERQIAARQLEAIVARLSHLLAQLLTVARLDASVPTQNVERVDIAEELRVRLVEHATRARGKNITLELEAPDHLLTVTNRFAINSIVDNLVDNAIRYCPAAALVQVSLAQTQDGYQLAVRDSGPGIAPELRERVFERFYRIPGTDTAGSGLGLAIVKKIAQTQGAILRLTEGLNGRGLGVVLSVPARVVGR